MPSVSDYVAVNRVAVDVPAGFSTGGGDEIWNHGVLLLATAAPCGQDGGVPHLKEFRQPQRLTWSRPVLSTGNRD
jgi:hypothetical protein